MKKMIITGCYSNDHMKIFSRIFNETSPDYVHIISSNRDIAFEYEEAEYKYTYLDQAVKGEYCEREYELLPLDEPLIYSMATCETMVLKMIERHEGDGIPYTYNYRRRLYLKHLRYWNHIIESKKIDIFFALDIPHEPFDFVIYSLCIQKSIPVRFPHQGPVQDTFFCLNNHKYNIPELKDCSKYNKVVLTDSFKKYYENQVTDDEKAVPFYMKDMLGTKELQRKRRGYGQRILSISLFKYLIKKTIFYPYYLLKDIKKMKSVHNDPWDILKEFYNANSSELDLSKKFIYFPLHFQPEVTSIPMGGAFVDQYLVTQMLDFHLPDDVFIYVKEHPAQGYHASARSLDFYKELIRIPKVRLIRSEESSFLLQRASIAVATLSGTAGIESLMRKKPVFLFGSFIYQFANGVFQIKSNQDCEMAINNVINNNLRISEKDNLDFLKAYQENASIGYTDNDYKEVSLLSNSDNNENLYEAFLKMIKDAAR